MRVEIENIVKRIKSNINFRHVVQEAIANSLDAGATIINVKFIEKDTILDGEYYLEKITVEDNGIGFTADNRASFLTYMSKFKEKLGCKGVGRFTWLKVFEKVSIQSYTKSEEVEIVFTLNFNAEKDMLVENVATNECKTTVTFENIIEKNINFDMDKIKLDLVDHFSPTLYFMTNNVQINLTNSQKTLIINKGDAYKFKEKHFKIVANNNNTHDFTIYYYFSPDGKGKSRIYLSADRRVVEEISEIKDKTQNGEDLLVVVASKYLDDRVIEDRTGFNIDKKAKNANLYDDLTYKEIVEKINEQVDEIIKENYPNLQEENESVINDCINDYPYLAKYIMKDKSIIKRPAEIINVAKKAFEEDKKSTKDNFIKLLQNKDISDDQLVQEMDKLNDLSNRELAQYILYRQAIIKALIDLTAEGEKKESLLHKLFMSEKSANDKDALKKRYDNCLWLLDDKFMSFISCHSNKKFETIKRKINEIDVESGVLKGNDSQRRSDLSIFYSNRDAVVVEFKAAGAKEKREAITQINNYLDIIVKNSDIDRVYGFIITKLDESTINDFSRQQGVRMMKSSTNIPIFYYYNDNIKNNDGNYTPCHVYIMSLETICKDAEERNRVFLEIIKNT